MENSNSSFVNADPSSSIIQQSNLNDGQPWSSSLLCRSPPVEVDWTDSILMILPFGIDPSPDSNPSPAGPVETPPPDRDQVVINNENDGSSTIAPFVSPCRDLSPAPERLVEIPRSDSIENMVFEEPFVAMPPPLSPMSLPCNQMMNIENNGDFDHSTSFMISNLDSNPESVRSVEMSEYVPTENMVFEEPCVAMSSPPPPPLLPCNEMTNIENGLFCPTSSFSLSNLDSNLAPVRSDEMPQYVPTENMVFEELCVAMSSPPPPSLLPCNQMMNIENDLFFPTSSFSLSNLDSNPEPVRSVEMSEYVPTENMVFEEPCVAMSPSPPPLAPCNQMTNIENDLFCPTSSFLISNLDSNLAPVRSDEMPQYVPAENMVFETPFVAMSQPPPPLSPPRNQTMNIENGFSPTSSFLISNILDSNPAPARSVVGMPQYVPTENMVFKNPHVAMSPPRNQTTNIENGNFICPTSFLIPNLDSNQVPMRRFKMSRFVPPHNQTMNTKNGYNPTSFFIPRPDPNPVMHPFNPTENMGFENSLTAMLSSSSPPRNQTTNTMNHDFRQFGNQYKTNADIICENYMETYRVDSSSVRTAVDRSSTAAFSNFSNFNDNNGLVFSSGNEMQHFPAAAAGCLSSTEVPPPCKEVEAAAHGGADSSAFKRQWTVLEHKLLLVGMEIFGRGNWTNIADKVVMTKSNTQVSSHAQKYFERLELPSHKKREKRVSIHDITTVDPELLSMVRARIGPLSSLPGNK